MPDALWKHCLDLLSADADDRRKQTKRIIISILSSFLALGVMLSHI
jgi:hypothetical protein